MTVLLYGGALKANRVGAFLKCGYAFDVIRPGYDSQGRRHASWTQVVHDGVPIYTAKMMLPVEDFLARFDEKWATHIGEDEKLLARALEMAKNDHINRFRDGITGQTPAPSISQDGRDEGQTYST